jgi:hypothetical protein
MVHIKPRLIFSQRFFQFYSKPLTFSELGGSSEANDARGILCWPQVLKISNKSSDANLF